MSAILSFFGGSAFRMVWGEVSAWLTRRQEHAQEVELIKLQESIEAARHARHQSAIKAQADAGVQVVPVAAEPSPEMDAWLRTVTATTRKTGVAWVDAWNGAIRPMLATLATLAVALEVAAAGYVLSDWHQGLVAAILGVYIADRSLTKRGK